MEIGALIHFNMATYAPAGTRPGGVCSPNASTFNPTQLSTDQWAESFAAFGAREAVLVVQHNCGFVTWPSEAKSADGSRYNYSVAYSTWRGGQGDLVADFKASSLKRGIGVGYYYSMGHRPGNPVVRPTADVELQQLNELWGKYGNDGNLTEIWFDGGFEETVRPELRKMLARLQPTATAFNGCVNKNGAESKSTCITPNALRWIGTEAGAAPDPTWSTGLKGGGSTTNANANVYCPGESDTTLQNSDQ
jgi:alpha-L-fucosidase